MCSVFDVSMYGEFKDPENVDMKPVHDWLSKKGKFMYAPTEKMKREWRDLLKLEIMRDYMKNHRIIKIDKDAVESKQKNLTGLESNDEHLIALALVGGAKLLFSHDTKLHRDFKKKVRGDVYQTKKDHAHLLRKHTCPR